MRLLLVIMFFRMVFSSGVASSAISVSLMNVVIMAFSRSLRGMIGKVCGK